MREWKKGQRWRESSLPLRCPAMEKGWQGQEPVQMWAV